MTELPKGCSLTPEEGAGRAAEFRALAKHALVSRERTEGQVVLRFAPEPGTLDTVEDLARRERECCPFLDLRVTEDDRGVMLAIGAAAEDRAALDAFYELAAS